MDTEWKFMRTKLWLRWAYKRAVLPPPFNLLYVLLPFLWVIKRLITLCCPCTQVSACNRLFITTIKKKQIPSWWFFAVVNTLSRRNLNKFNGLIVFKVHLVHFIFHEAVGMLKSSNCSFPLAHCDNKSHFQTD